MAPNNGRIQLMQPIVLELGHYGFVGHTSNRITIEANGDWKVSGLLNGQEFRVHDSGTLSPDELEQLVDALAALNHASLPDAIGQPMVNGGTLSIGFGSQISTMNLDASGELPQQAGDAGERMLAFSKEIAALISPGN